MSHHNLKTAAASKPAWRSTVLTTVGGANIKVMQMDSAPYPDESHDYPECLLVTDGQINLQIHEELVIVRAGEMYVIPPGVAHAVAPGSSGTCLIIDQ
ncbi:cupin domain-containing protein [Geothrix sp. SG200]|uniref:cupin domain-containing protein n=1 Tax=Geothrix sp. SG200 TaxID=2922865 RepID=UPI001FAD7674|nr:cupin domain-containing protein [Geothrix sp. SG200]